jgi:RHS repeat-associated protein
MHQWNANTYAFTSPYRFNAKELDPETGLAYYGARYYQNKMGIWLSVDPLAKNTLQQFQFNHNNPVMRIDPNGLDDYGLNQDGKIVLLRTNNSPTDRLIVLNSKGGETKREIQLKHCLLSNVYKNQNSYGIMIHNDDIEADRIFKFMAKTFDGSSGGKEIEIGMVRGNKDDLTTTVIYTEGSSNSTQTGLVAKDLKMAGYFIEMTVHSHPGGIEYSMPSGVYSNGRVNKEREKSDILAAQNLDKVVNSNILNFTYHPQSGKIFNFTGKSIKQVPQWRGYSF